MTLKKKNPKPQNDFVFLTLRSVLFLAVCGLVDTELMKSQLTKRVGLDSCVLRGGGKIVSLNFFLWHSSCCPLEIEAFIPVVYVGWLGVSI